MERDAKLDSRTDGHRELTKLAVPTITAVLWTVPVTLNSGVGGTPASAAASGRSSSAPHSRMSRRHRDISRSWPKLAATGREKKWWALQESKQQLAPDDVQAPQGLADDGPTCAPTGAHTERHRAAFGGLIDRLAGAVRELLAAGPPLLPDELRADLARLLAGDDATRSPLAGKLVGDRAAQGDSREGGLHGAV